MCNKGNKGGRAGKVVLVGVCAVGEVGWHSRQRILTLSSAASWIFCEPLGPLKLPFGLLD
jgi:hypothetical protein